MARLTIILPDALYRALKEETAKRGTTTRQIVEECLDKAGIESSPSAESLVARARARAAGGEEEAIRLAVEETRAVRNACDATLV